jgi:hypothetical protein
MNITSRLVLFCYLSSFAQRVHNTAFGLQFRLRVPGHRWRDIIRSNEKSCWVTCYPVVGLELLGISRDEIYGQPVRHGWAVLCIISS